MNILLINYMETTGPGGINKVVREIGRNLSKEGHKITVLQRNCDNLPKDELFENFRIIRINSKIGRYFYDFCPEGYCYVMQNIGMLNPDIIHIHGFLTLFSLGMIFTIKKLINKPIPVIFSPHYASGSHNTLIGKHFSAIYNSLAKFAFDYADKIILASDYEYKIITDNFGVDPKKCLIVPHGVDKIESKKKRTNPNSISLLYVGYLIELKGVQHIMRSVRILKNKLNQDVSLTVIGEGSYKSTLMKLSETLSIKESIFWYPFLVGEDLYRKYRDTDIFLLLSSSENYGIVAAESLASGTPCIVANTASLSEFLGEPGCFGVAYPPNPEEVANLVIKIHNSRVTVGPFSAKIRLWDEVAANYERIYFDLLSRRM